MYTNPVNGQTDLLHYCCGIRKKEMIFMGIDFNIKNMRYSYIAFVIYVYIH